jgi:hypothetical protein
MKLAERRKGLDSLLAYSYNPLCDMVQHIQLDYIPPRVILLA